MVTRRTTLSLLLSAATGLIASAAPSASAEKFPSRVVNIVVGGPAGTPPDIISRMIGSELAHLEGWSAVVENKPGAMQMLGAADVLRQPADGHTILCVSLPAALAPYLLQSVNVQLDVDFTPLI